VVGEEVLMPSLINSFDFRLSEAFMPFVKTLSTIVAFILLFLLVRLALSLAVSIAGSIFDKGIIGRINKSLGFVLIGSISFVLALIIVPIIDVLFQQEQLSASPLVRDFSGGPAYRILYLLTPFKSFTDK
jgi:hypothetical protein